jgi:putative ABC transport system permease protein
MRFASGVDDEAMLADLEARYTDVGPALRPGSVDNLDELGLLPLVLAALVTGLGALAGGLALTAATSRSRRELATLLALGASRGQVGRTVVAHGITLAGVAIVLGTPIGVGIGRAVYRAVADGIGAIVRPAVPLASLAALAAGAVLAAIVLATPPALAAARRRPALALRNE